MKKILVLVALLSLLIGVISTGADEPDDDVLFLSPVMNPVVVEGAVDLMAPCGSFEYSGCWEMQPEDQIYYEPDRASDGNRALVQGRIEPDPHKVDEVAYYCWDAGELDGYMHFILYMDKECVTNDVMRLNHSRMSLIIWEGDHWRALTGYFGYLYYEDCGATFTWKPEAYWFDGLEAYTGYPICLSIESVFPSVYRTYNWRDNGRLMALEVVSRIYLAIIMR